MSETNVRNKWKTVTLLFIALCMPYPAQSRKNKYNFNAANNYSQQLPGGGIATSALTNFAAISSVAQAGTVYLPFGTRGTGIVNTGTGAAYSVTLQRDGKIVAVGSDSSTPNNWQVVRYNPNGTPDTNFGTNGTGIINEGSGQAKSIALQSDDKIIVTGRQTTPAPNDFWQIIRYNTDGSVDTIFNGNGIINGGFGLAESIALQSNGKIVVAGTAFGNTWQVIRYNTDGSLDTTFNGTGTAGNVGTGRGYSVALQSNGKIVVAGEDNSVPNNWQIVRYNSDGTPDASFGTNGTGIVQTNTGIAYSVAIQSDDKIVVAGIDNATPTNWQVIRYNTDGTPDASFGTNGTGIINEGSGTAESIALQSDGKIIVTGNQTTPGPNYFWQLIRYNANGAHDTNFDIQNGLLSGFTHSVALQSNGMIVVAGQSGTPFWRIVEYTNNYIPPAQYTAIGGFVG